MKRIGMVLSEYAGLESRPAAEPGFGTVRVKAHGR